MPVNRLLTDEDRKFLEPTINLMWKVCPNIMRKKIERANVQQAFVLYETLRNMVHPTPSNILSVGCFDDTAFEYLKTIGANIVGIDPVYGYDLHQFRQSHSTQFNIAFATSVIEHVQNDEEFIKDMCDILLPDGIGILTMDFNNNYKLGDKLPRTDLRFYRRIDLEVRLYDVLIRNNCRLIDTPDWSGEPEFTHDGCNYSFATFVFRKN